MNQTTEITAENVCDFLKKFATDISIEDLKPISKRHGGGDSTHTLKRGASVS